MVGFPSHRPFREDHQAGATGRSAASPTGAVEAAMMGNEPRVIVGKFDGASMMAPVWFMGWLFTIGFAHLHLIKGFLALILWPFYLGGALTHP